MRTDLMLSFHVSPMTELIRAALGSWPEIAPPIRRMRNLASLKRPTLLPGTWGCERYCALSRVILSSVLEALVLSCLRFQRMQMRQTQAVWHQRRAPESIAQW